MVNCQGRFEWARLYAAPSERLKRSAPESESCLYEVKKKMTYAVIETGGKQYRVTEGDVIYVEKLGAEADQSVTFDKVLAVVSDGKATVGKPLVEGAAVTGTVLKNGRARKIIVFKMRPKKNYRRKQGHRQPYSKVRIDKISV